MIANIRNNLACFLMGLAAKIGTKQYRDQLAQFITDGIAVSQRPVDEADLEELRERWVSVN